LNEALYQVSVSGATTSTGAYQAPCAVTFHYAANGLDVVKTFRFDSTYEVTAEVAVRRNGFPVRALLAWPSGLGDQTESTHFVYGKFAWSLGGKDDSTDAKKLSGGETLNQPYEYASIIDLYFAAAFLPDNPANTTVVTLHNSIEVLSDPADANSQKKPADVIGLAVGDVSGVTRLRLFAGPKETDLLKTIRATGGDGKPSGPSLEPLIQLGWLTVIAKPLYLALRFLRTTLGAGGNNWGWAIILFTAAFNLIMMPTRFWAMKSSLKMMRIQPKVDVIKNRYKNMKATDPKRAEMNTEMMELYRNEGVNMYGSCLPMLPQIPLFFAYFRVLQNAVELRQAHWFWLTDLSSPDPKYILPILIIVSMFLTQYITPAPGMDPAQRKMMAFMMPLFMGFVLLHYASGLALYWGTSNLINLALQLAINQSAMGKEMHAIAARKAAKKAGTIAGQIQKRR
jgi:YidC/Oxa1 family membrane protein insertase